MGVEFRKGDKVRVWNCERITHSGCNGMVGVLTRKSKFAGRIFYEVTATEERPHKWKVGQHADFLESELQRVVEK